MPANPKKKRRAPNQGTPAKKAASKRPPAKKKSLARQPGPRKNKPTAPDHMACPTCYGYGELDQDGRPLEKHVGRPHAIVDREMVIALASIYCTYAEISAVVGCSVSTLKRDFEPLIKKGWDEAKASIRRQQYQLAMDKNPTMLIWLGKQYLDQSDKVDSRHQILGGQGQYGPKPIDVMTDEEVEAELDQLTEDASPSTPGDGPQE